MPDQFGKYELHERLGHGGMAEVYRATTRGPEGFAREVCIKRILPHLSRDPDFVRLFIREAQVAARLTHSNIVQIHDFDAIEGQYYLAMEFVRGADLRRILDTAAARARPIPCDVASFVSGEILKALRHAHGHRGVTQAEPVIHRDVSPHNVLVSFSGEVKLSDFGIAKAQKESTASSPSVIRGKLGYLAPEQVQGGVIDERADLFALGAILFELLSGRRFREGTETEQVAQALAGEFSPLPANVPPDLAGLVVRLLAKEPANRPRSAQVALSMLSECRDYRGESAGLEVYVADLLPAEIARESRERTVGLPWAVARPADAATRTHSGQLARLSPSRSTRVGASVALGVAFALGVAWVTRTEGDSSAPRASKSTVTAAMDGPAADAFIGPLARSDAASPDAENMGATETDAAPSTALAKSRPIAALIPRPAPADRNPSAKPAEGKAERRAVSAAPGFLSVSARPWGMVYVDRRYLQQTPMIRKALQPGRHTLEIRNDELKRRVRRNIVVRSGEELRVSEKFEDLR